MADQVNLSTINTLHQQSIIQWKADGIQYHYTGFYSLVEKNHAFNYQLWHAEDKARRDDMGPEFVYQAKREIDGHNQKRNDSMEAIDQWLIEALKPAGPQLCSVHSESPGMMIDRLSILSLKAYHMALQTQRTDVDEAHRKTCTLKFAVIQQQQEQLTQCLQQLYEEVLAQTRTFRVYHQMKMYNDPSLNPELYLSSKD